MSRPKPTVLLEHVNKSNYKSDQVVEASGIWVVMFDNQPINLKSSHYLNVEFTPKYKKTSFSNPGHAINLCKKLNNLFKTDKFTVVLLKQGEQIYP